MRCTAFTRTVMAAVAVATIVAGVAEQAQAFTFEEGDLVLAIYGINAEMLYNLGQVNTRLANGASYSLDVSAGLTATQVGINPVKYTVFEWDLVLPDGQVIAATPFSASQISGSSISLVDQLNPSILFSTQTQTQGLTFTSQLNAGGNGSLGGAWPVRMEGNLDQMLNLMQGDVATNTFSQVGRVLLTSGGLVTIGSPGPAAVPLPAGVVLFGTGLIGLVGMARRVAAGHRAARLN